jgi:hypothetical protein
LQEDDELQYLQGMFRAIVKDLSREQVLDPDNRIGSTVAGWRALLDEHVLTRVKHVDKENKEHIRGTKLGRGLSVGSQMSEMSELTQDTQGSELDEDVPAAPTITLTGRLL